ncbi:tryptophan--tRNA ligase [Mollicutes bacterium LVI A0039]|nr:tryptophan--tRNA ligase [Mollicutes bacterium LVI A0039]
MVTFSGIQPSGIVTLGNYLGALKHFKANGAKEDNLYCIVDLHAMTSTTDGPAMRAQSKTLAAIYMALGIHEHSTIFIQSHVPMHSELAWILQCTSRMGELERMTQYKDKSSKNIAVNVGLFTYPTLMAADILLYDTTDVPVGIDQKQHIEFTRDLAERFNSTYKELFVLPEPRIAKQGAKIYSLTEPTKKMSKSDANPKSYISVLDDEATIRRKIKSATTDSIGEINFDEENQPGVSNLLTIFSLCRDMSIEDTVAHFSGQNYGFLKSEVADAIVAELMPIQERYHAIINDKTLLSDTLKAGSEVAGKKAWRKMQKVKKAVGFYNE